MGALSRLRNDLDQLASVLDEAGGVPDASGQPEMARARAGIDEARAALSSAFLSRRAMILAREAIARAQPMVAEARRVSCVLRERSAALRKDAADIRAMAAEAREASEVASERSCRLLDPPTGASTAEVVIESGIPPEHPAKQAIEAAVTDALRVTGGKWQAWITVPTEGNWWGLRVHGHLIDWVCTLHGAGEQTPESVTARLQPVIRLALTELLYLQGRTLVRSRRRADADDRRD